MTPLVRYTLVQIPGWIILACLAGWALAQDWITGSTAAWIAGLWLLKDAALYPLCKPGFETGPASGAQSLVGREVRVISELNPRGQVWLNGERWAAYCPDTTVAAGTTARVRDADGLTLIVEPAAEGSRTSHARKTE